jgi:hypothetical protein
MVGLYMNDEPERIWKEQVVTYWRCCFGGAEGHHDMVTSVLAEVRRNHLPNTSLQRYV